MSKASLFAISTAFFLFTQQVALGQTDPAQENTEEGSEQSTQGNGSTLWPDIFDLIADLIDPEDEG